MAAYGRKERVHRSHGYHRRAHGAIGGATTTNAPLPAPSPPPSLTPNCSNPHTQPTDYVPAALAARYELGQAARSNGGNPRERGVRATPLPLLKHSPQEARGKEGVWQGEHSSWSSLRSGLVWGSTHLQRGLLGEKLIQRSKHGMRRAFVWSEVGRPRPGGACWGLRAAEVLRSSLQNTLKLKRNRFNWVTAGLKTSSIKKTY